jgi:fibronectin-binding autotransporter adhesin
MSFAADEIWSGITILNSTANVEAGNTLQLVSKDSPSENIDLTIGYGVSATGELNVTGGLVTLTGTGGSNGIYVGDAGAQGTLNVSSGTISYGGVGNANHFWVGMGVGSVGTVNHSGGLIDLNTNATGASFDIGINSGTGIYNLSGDAVHDSGITIVIGHGVGGYGRLDVSQSAKFSALVGDTGTRLGWSGGTGVIHQSGSSLVEFANPAAFRVGEGAGSLGTYELVSGTLVMNVGEGAQVGPRFGVSSGTGRFLQSGGSSSFQGYTIRLGDSGVGEFLVTGGTASIQKGMILGYGATGSGTLSLNGGILEVGGANGLQKGSGSARFNMGGGTLRVTGTSFTTSLDVNLTEDTTSTIATNGLNATFSGTISGEGNIVKSDEGVLTFLAENTYTGSTSVTEGTLHLAAGASTGAGEVLIGEDAILSGNGSVKGAATIEGRLNPGNSPGELTFSEGLTLAGSSITTLEINGTNPGDYDHIVLTGGPLVLEDGVLILNFAEEFEGGQSFGLFSLAGDSEVIGNFGEIKLTGAYGDLDLAFNGVDWRAASGENQFIYNTQTGTLNLNVIPEPSAGLLLLTGAAGLLAGRRRRA